MAKSSALKLAKEEEIDFSKEAVSFEDDNEIASTKALSPREFEEIIVSHQEFGMKLAWSFLGGWRIRMNQDEVQSCVGAALVEAGTRFDPSRGVSFKTFFFYYLRGILLKEISRMIDSQKNTVLTPEFVNESYETSAIPNWRFSLIENDDPEKIMAKRERALVCWKACEELDPLEQEVVVQTFAYDKPLVQVAKELGYCRCHVSRVKSNALVKLRGLLDKSCYEEFVNKKDKSASEKKMIVRKSSQAKRITKSSYKGGRGRRKQSLPIGGMSTSLEKVLKQYAY